MAIDLTPRYLPAPIEQVTIGPDRVPALFVRPESGELCPAVLLQHGYGVQKSDFLPLATILATCGFAMLLPDAWGHGERPKEAGLAWWSRMPVD